MTATMAPASTPRRPTKHTSRSHLHCQGVREAHGPPGRTARRRRRFRNQPRSWASPAAMHGSDQRRRHVLHRRQAKDAQGPFRASLPAEIIDKFGSIWDSPASCRWSSRWRLLGLSECAQRREQDEHSPDRQDRPSADGRRSGRYRVPPAVGQQSTGQRHVRCTGRLPKHISTPHNHPHADHSRECAGMPPFRAAIVWGCSTG